MLQKNATEKCYRKTVALLIYILIFSPFCFNQTFGQVKVKSSGLTMLGSVKPQIDKYLRTYANDQTSLWVNGKNAPNWGRASWTTIYQPYATSWVVRARYKPYSAWPLPYHLRSRDVFYVRGDGQVWTERGILSASDSSLKCNISNISNALNLIEQLDGKYYKYRLDTSIIFDSLTVASALPRMGFISQEIANVLPGLVDTVYGDDSTYTTGVYYSDFIPLLTEGIKEQQLEIESLETQIASHTTTIANLQSQINSFVLQLESCCQGETPYDGTDKTNDIFNIPNDNVPNTPFIQQNIPNPFSQNTIIKYFIPDNKSAILYIHNLNGEEISAIKLHNSGNSEVAISAYSLNPGMYNYTLVVEGVIIDTKKMILTR